MNHIVKFLFIFNFALVFNALAKTPSEIGQEIAKAMQERSEGYLGEIGTMTMILINAHGEKIERKMTGKVLEIKDEGDWSLSEFLSPLDVKGTKMLTWSYKNENDKQWLYLPAIKRVKRISSSSRFSSFMGSEFSYEDLGGQEIEKYNFLWLRDEKNMWVLERTSKEESGYSKQILFVEKESYSTKKIEYYDRKGELLKISEFLDFKDYKVGKKVFHKANKITMKNLQTRKESIFEWSERKVGVEISKSELTEKALK